MSVLPVADIGTDQLPLTHYVPEDFALHDGAGRQSDGYDSATRSDVVQSLLVAGRTSRGDDRSVRAKAVFSCLFDGRHNVLFFLEVDPHFGTEGCAQILLGGSGLPYVQLSEFALFE